jgi:uncharacterized membrane protein YebE (DUF533 family)
MSAQSMLDQLLKSGLSMLNSKGAQRGDSGAGLGKLGNLGDLGVGATAGGVLGLLLGTKRGRSMGGSALKYGSVAALGAVAFRAYTQWQATQAAQAQQTQQAQQAPQGLAAENVPVRTVNLLPAPEVETHSRAMLQAMIAAAKSDGHLDARERELIDAELVRLQADVGERQWMEAELQRPLDPAEVARAASTPEMAAEMYLASLLMVDDTSFMERAYLDELARQLRLPAGLKAELEAQSQAA